MVQGVITGDINEMGVKFTKKWIVHPKGLTDETEFVGMLDKETGTVKGTFKIGNISGEWVMDKQTSKDSISASKNTLPNNLSISDINSYEGNWAGTYSCRQGITGLLLQLKPVSSNRLEGVFNFFPIAQNPNVPNGSFRVHGVLNKDGKLLVRGGQWIQRPRNFSTVNLEGRISPDFQQISGRVLTYGCGEFVILKKPN